MKEIWKNIKDYEKLYQISNFGNVKSLSKFHKTNKNYSSIGYLSKEKILKPQLNYYGYYVVNLSKNGKTKVIPIHKLVAMHFIKNINNYKIINHKDGNKLNNNADNLEWCTSKHNIQHAYDNDLMKNCIKVSQFNKSGEHIKDYSSINKASKETNISQASISQCILGKRKQAGGYIWIKIEERLDEK